MLINVYIIYINVYCLVKEIMKRWKNLRDTFKKEFKKYEKSGSSMKKKAKYCYYDTLSFLQPNLIGRM